MIFVCTKLLYSCGEKMVQDLVVVEEKERQFCWNSTSSQFVVRDANDDAREDNDTNDAKELSYSQNVRRTM